MFKAKSIAIALAATVAAGLISLPVSAASASGTIINLPDKDSTKMKLVTNFDEFSVGALDKKAISGAVTGADKFCDISITADNALSGNAWKWDALTGLTDGQWEQVNLNTEYLPKPVVNFEGADSIGYYVDCSGYTSAVSSMFLFQEYDYDANGKVVMDDVKNEPAQSAWLASTSFYTMDADGNWVSQPIDASGWMTIPAGYKGYIKMPLSNFKIAWNSDDVNEKMDLKHVTTLIFCHGLYPDFAGKTPYTIDNVGFMGANVKEDVVSTPSTSSKATSTTNTNSTTTTTTTTDNPKTGSQPIAAVVLLAAVAASAGAVLKIKRSK